MIILNMKKHDIIFIILLILIFIPFILSSNIFNAYLTFNHNHSLMTSFIKFAILATIGEIIGLRIKTGVYTKPGFGILPRMLVWGFIGVTIKIAMVIFAIGTPYLLEYLGLNGAIKSMGGDFTLEKLFVSFSISVFLNVIYAPVMMTFHRITDMHINNTGGTIRGFFTPFGFNNLLLNLDWDVQWNFVFKKTIPLFWIPAHTITFLLPPDFRILFAAILGIALGTILAIADIMGDSKSIMKK